MASYELFNASAGVPGLTSCTIEISDELGELSIGDTVDYTAYVKTVAGFPGNVELAFGLRTAAYADTFYATRYRGSSYEFQRLSPNGYFSVYKSGITIVSFTGQTITMTGTINVTQQVLAGLLEASENLELGIFVRYRRSSSDSWNTSSRAAVTGMSVSSSGYTMPDLSAMVYYDNGSGNPLVVFGDYVQGKSVPRLTVRAANISIDSRFTGAPFYCRRKVIRPDGTVFENKNISLPSSSSYNQYTMSVLDTRDAGTATWTLYIEDADGICGVTTGSFEVLPYAAPQLTFGVTRYTEILGDNDEASYEESDDGENVWLDISAITSPLNGSNAWTLTLTYSPNDNGGVLPMTLLSDTDGNTVARVHDRTLLTALFSAANDYTFTATLTDRFGGSVVTTYIYKAGGYANLEKFGFRIGGRTTGTAQAPKFESDYPAYMYAGIQGVNNYSTAEVLTGGHWIDGKPLYHKVLHVTTKDTIDISDLDFDFIRWELAYKFTFGSSAAIQWSSTYYYSSSDYAMLYVNGTNLIVRMCSNIHLIDCYIFLEYTKTTD